MREVLGGGSGGRPWADGSDTVHIVPDCKNLPVEFTETRFPLLVEPLALAPDSGGAGQRRGGLGYRKEIRPLADSYFLSVADRSILACWGLKGGQAGQPFRVTVDPGRPAASASWRAWSTTSRSPRAPSCAIDTTGGGGWGDPLEREPTLVVLDVIQGKVSARAARDDYGVVLVTEPTTARSPPTRTPRPPSEAGSTPNAQRLRRARRDALLRSRPGLPPAQRPGLRQTSILS